MKPGAYILYLGPYTDDRVEAERGISANPAASNRMRRLAGAMSLAGFNTVILSPGSGMRLRQTGGRERIHRAHGHFGKIAVLYSAFVCVPVLGYVLGIFSTALAVWGVCRKRKVACFAAYNYYPGQMLAMIIARFFLRLPMVLELEELAIPTLSHWRRDSEIRPVQRLVFWACMKMATGLSPTVIVTTRRFLPALESANRTTVISGCMATEPGPEHALKNAKPLRVLYCGQIEFGHGASVLAEAILALDKNPERAGRFEFHIAGRGSKEPWLRKQLEQLSHVHVYFHGFLSDASYRELLTSADIGLALQSPASVEASHNVPSKAYEFMGNGKATILTDVGDFDCLPNSVCVMLETYTGECLARTLERLSAEEFHWLGMNAREFARENWSLEKAAQKIGHLLNTKQQR